MARITVEDCTKIVKNRFELVVVASRRAKDLSTGIESELEKGKDKNAVLALREIAARKVKVKDIKEKIIAAYESYSAPTDDAVTDTTKEIYKQETGQDVDKDNLQAEKPAADDQKMFSQDNVVVDD
jgi:DNA-directed RNA polymerase subunit omega